MFITGVPIRKLFTRGEGDSGGHVLRDGTREEPGTLTQGGALFSLVPLVWETNSNSRVAGDPNHQPNGGKSHDADARGVCLFLQKQKIGAELHIPYTQ